MTQREGKGRIAAGLFCAAAACIYQAVVELSLSRGRGNLSNRILQGKFNFLVVNFWVMAPQALFLSASEVLLPRTLFTTTHDCTPPHTRVCFSSSF